ncbi:MAG: ABC transporter permease, partial [Betaproteobacteria bacterium]
WWLIPLVLVQALLTIACGLLAALLVCIQRDFRLLIQLGTVFLLFMSGVFWDLNAITDESLRDWLMVLNPLATLIDAYRQVLMLGTPPSSERLFWMLTESVLLLLTVLFTYHRLQFWIARQVVSR